ncbi:MAG: outer membrane lipoprotein carrier protein LolA [Candidatus Cryptobacteroides sp.]
MKDKKRYFFAAIIAVLTASLQVLSAQDCDAILQALQQKNAPVEGFQGKFSQTKTLVNGHEIKSHGTLYYAGPDRMSMIYMEPFGEKFVINSGRMLVRRDGKSNVYDLGKNRRMNSLAVTLLYCMQGRIAELAESCDASVDASRNGSGWQITLTARGKTSGGYSMIELRYAPDGGIRYMKMTEPSGIFTTYEMPSLSASLPSDVFILK